MLANNLYDINTKINVSYSRFNMNRLGFINSNVSKITTSKNIHEIIKTPQIIPKEFRFSIITIPKYTVVFIIDNEASFFSVNAYADLLMNSNINLVISSNDKFRDYIEKFYNNIYNSNQKYDNIIFTNKLFKKLPLNSVDINKCYIFNNDYNIKNRYNCFYINNRTDIVSLDVEEYDYQKFSSDSINWFISKMFNNTLHTYNPSNIIICTDNLEYLDSTQYIFLDKDVINYFNLYYNWFNFSYSSYNIQLSEFILLIIGYYYSKLTIYSNIFIDSYINNKTDDTIGLKKENLLKGIQVRSKYIGDFFDYIKLVLNKFGNINVDIDRLTNINHIALIKNYDKEIIIKDILVKRLNHDIDKIEIIKSFYPYKNIWIFESFQDLTKISDELNKFPNENLKIIMHTSEIYKIYNHPSTNIYRNTQLSEYVLDFEKIRNYTIENILKEIRSYSNKVILTILVDTNNNYNYFKYYYNQKGYKIIFLNLFNLPTDNIELDNNILIINYSDSIVKNTDLFFIKPNFYFTDDLIHDYSYKLMRCKYYKDITKSLIYAGIYSYKQNIEFRNLYIVDLEITILQRIKLNKFYNSILNNAYIGLFSN